LKTYLLLVQFIKSSQVFENSDESSNDSKKQFKAEEAEDDEFFFLD